jgi:proline racemase
VPSDKADFGAFFISTYVYLDMCGHGTIGYAKTLAATGAIAAPQPHFTLETPAGVVTVGLAWDADGNLATARVANVPCWVGREGVTVSVDGIGDVTADLAYGGIWYAVVDAAPIGLALEPACVGKALAWGAAIKRALGRALQDDDPGLGGGVEPSVLFHRDASRLRSRHLLVLEANKFDRSPCGTGTSARVALLASRGLVSDADTYVAENLLGTPFAARIAGRVVVSGRDAVIPEIEGSAYITAFSTLVKEVTDPLSGGFLCR